MGERIKRHIKLRRKRKVNGKNKKVQLVLKEKVKWTRGEIKCEGEKRKDYEERIKGTIAKKENKK